MNSKLIDPYGRQFPYLRLSLTDVCNFSCSYCLPDGYQCETKPSPLSLSEIKRLVNAFAELGTWKIRLTGGEPTIRKEFQSILKLVSATPGIDQVAMTTNGYKLKEKIESWVENGLTHLNVSVDSLDPKLFHDLTGHNRLQEILEGIDLALTLPLKQIKLNAVLLNKVNSHQFDEYAQFVKDKDISIRFIELMQTGDNQAYFNQYHVSAETLTTHLTNKGWQVQSKRPGSGPAIEYRHPDHKGSFGVIAPYSEDFCDSCNRLRISSHGEFHLCLFGERGFSIRHLLQTDDQKETLKATLIRLLGNKRKSHFLHDGDTGVTPHLASVGG